MDKAQMQKLASIARTAGVSWSYYACLADAQLHDQPLDAELVAERIYADAMLVRKARLYKYKEDAINNAATGDTASRMLRARYFATCNGALDDYALYIEECVLSVHPFDLEHCVETVFKTAIAKYEWHLSHKILIATGIAVGGENAVQ